MNQRLIAAVVAAPLVLVLVVAASVLPLPFVTYEPGQTFDVLADENGVEIIQVDGHEVYRDDGELRMTTVLVSVPRQSKNLVEVLAAWADGDDAVYPYDAIYDREDTAEDSTIEGSVEMVTSQDTATAVALRELGYDIPTSLKVAYVYGDSPAKGKLRARDTLLRVGSTPISTDGPDGVAGAQQQVVTAIREAGVGNPLEITVQRGDQRRTVELTPEKGEDGQARVGIQLAEGYQLPFDVSVNIDPDIGGPSAGLMFSLAIYDTLTPGSLSGGQSIAGTGTITSAGAVGPIGGIQQKVAGAREDGARLFLVPPGNCEDALQSDPGDMRLVRAETMSSALAAVQAWTEDPDADLPSCEDS